MNIHQTHYLYLLVFFNFIHALLEMLLCVLACCLIPKIGQLYETLWKHNHNRVMSALLSVNDTKRNKLHLTLVSLTY